MLVSDSDWRKQLPLGLTLALACAWLLPVAWSLIPSLEYDPSQYPTEIGRKEGREDQDTYAQIWMAWTGFAQSLIGGVGLALTIYFARKAWLEAQQANTDARERYLTDSRPWVSVHARIIGGASKTETFVAATSAKVTLELACRNVGKSIAFNFDIKTYAVNDDTDPFGHERIDALIADLQLLRRNPPANVGYPLFPNEDRTAPISVDLGDVSLPNRLVMFCGLVTYRSQAMMGDLHATPFFFLVDPGTYVKDQIPTDGMKVYHSPYGYVAPD